MIAAQARQAVNDGRQSDRGRRPRHIGAAGPGVGSWGSWLGAWWQRMGLGFAGKDTDRISKNVS